MKKLLLGIGILSTLFIGYYLLSPLWRTVEIQEDSPVTKTVALADSPLETKTLSEKENDIPMKEKMPKTAIVLSEKNFVAKDHEVSGKALLIEKDQEKIVRFEDFETVNGPDLHIYLATDFEAADFIDLGAIKATKGNINYTIPTNTDTNKYNKVLIWCVPFGVLFSAAEL